MNESTALQTIDPPAPPVGQMLQAMLDKGITTENVAVAERLMGLYERMQEKEAERQFAQAFNSLQAAMPAIQATKPVPNRDGTIRYHFAPYEAIMEAVRPLLLKHGFTVSFSSDVKDGRVVQFCTLQHTGGHKRTNQFAARVGNGPPGSSEAQGDGAASTYAKRFALCDALNITIERDGDARSEGSGETIPSDKAQYLRERVKETKSNEAAFLKYAGVTKYEDITADRYDELVKMLAKKTA